MSGVDQVLNYAQSHNMRARMHNLLWGKNSFNGQQPSWVLNTSNSGLLDQANNTSLTAAQRDTARADLRGEISERINYYLDSTRASKMVEMDVYNESAHVPQYTTAFGYDNVDGIASIHNEAAAKAPGVKMFTNDYNIFADSYNPVGSAYQPYNNWYFNEVAAIRDNGGNVGGIGAQYYPNTTGIGTGNDQHNAGRMMAVWQNLSVHGLPMALTEFGVKSGGEAAATQILEESMRLTFGQPNTTGFLMWGFWSGEGLFAGGSPFYDANWNLTDNGKKWQDLLGIADWDGNPNNAWDTSLTAAVGADGRINFTGFFGDYYLRGQTAGADDLTLAKGTTNYALNLAAPPAWSLWRPANSGAWGAAANWTTGGVAAGAGQTAYFGPAAAARSVTVDVDRTIGMLAFNSASSYTLAAGGGRILLQGFDSGGGHVAAIYVVAGDHTVGAPVQLIDDTTVTVASAGSLRLSDLQPTAAALAKAGPGTLEVNRVQAGALTVAGGAVRVLTNGTSTGTSRVASLSVAAGATFDLADNKLVVTAQPAAGVADLVKTGRLTSTSSAALAGITALAVAQAGDTRYAGSTFGGVSVVASDVLVMYTYAGDADLNGKLDGDDYFRLDAGFAARSAGWVNGDFNYDGRIDGDDYFLLDRTIGIQGAPLLTAEGVGVVPVPEPSAAGLVGASVLLAMRRRRR
jgi:GH35 family endo-1,4-beta-xylanase